MGPDDREITPCDFVPTDVLDVTLPLQSSEDLGDLFLRGRVRFEARDAVLMLGEGGSRARELDGELLTAWRGGVDTDADALVGPNGAKGLVALRGGKGVGERRSGVLGVPHHGVVWELEVLDAVVAGVELDPPFA